MRARCLAPSAPPLLWLGFAAAAAVVVAAGDGDGVEAPPCFCTKRPGESTDPQLCVGQATHSACGSSRTCMWTCPVDPTLTTQVNSGSKKWAFKTQGSLYDNSPALSPDGQVLYVGSGDGSLYAINTADGSRKWAFLTGSEVSKSPAVSSDGSVVYVQSGGYIEAVSGHWKKPLIWAINTADASQKWVTDVVSFNSATACQIELSGDGTVLYVGGFGERQGSSSSLFAINTADGSKKWTFPMADSQSSACGSAVSPAGDMVYVGSLFSSEIFYPNFYAVNTTDGSKKWAIRTGIGVQSTPVLSSNGAVVYVGNRDEHPDRTQYKRFGTLSAINTADGSVKWAFDTGSWITSSSPKLSPDGAVVFVGSGDKSLYAVNTTDGSKKWAFPTGSGTQSSPALSSDGAMVYVSVWTGKLYAINTEDGSAKWTFDMGDRTISSPAVSADGAVVFVGSGDKSLYAVNT